MFTKLWTVQMSDWERGLVIAVLTVPLTILYDYLSAGIWEFDWKKILGAALAVGIAYIVKNLTTGVNGKTLSNK